MKPECDICQAPATVQIDNELLCGKCECELSHPNGGNAIPIAPSSLTHDSHGKPYSGVRVAPPPETPRERRARFYRRGWWDFKASRYCPETWDKTLLRDYQAGWRESACANAAMKAVGAR